MPAKNQSNTSQRMQIVDFLDIDTSKITFKQPKLNKYNGSQIGILYNGETMYVKYEGNFLPYRPYPWEILFPLPKT